MKKNVMCFSEDEFLEDVAKRMSRKRYRAYPVVNASKELVAYILNQIHFQRHNNFFIEKY